MQFNTALSLSVLSLAGFSEYFKHIRLAKILFGGVLVLTAMTLIEYLFLVDMGIDNVFGFQTIITRAPHPGRMSPNTALSFFILSLISIFPRSRSKILNLQTLGIAIVWGLAMVSLISYMTAIEEVYAWQDIVGMALLTAICTLLISAAFLIRNSLLHQQSADRLGNHQAWLLAMLIGLAIFLVMVDLHLNDAVFSSPIYCLLIFFASYFSREIKLIVTVGVATVLIMFFSIYLKSEVDINKVHLADRIMALIIVMAFTFLIVRIKKAKNKLAALNRSLDQKVKERTRKLQLQNEELRQFTYIASHDLQEPLRTIRTLMDFIDQKDALKGDNKIEQAFTYVCDAADRMSDLVNALLDYSRLGRMRKTAFIDLNMLLADVKVDLSERIQISGAQIQSRPLPSCHVLPVEMRLLFQNLISNSIKFKQENTIPKIEIWAEDEVHQWKILIKDNGIGIAPQHQHKVFDLFKRLHSTKKFEGLGIGLAHCKKIVEMHNGEIHFQSKLGEGSTFFFTIPKLKVT